MSVRNKQLAEELLPEFEGMLDLFIQEHLDTELEMDDLVDQHDFIRRYIIKQLVKEL